MQSASSSSSSIKLDNKKKIDIMVYVHTMLKT